jgi:hypothetical protein
MSNTAQDGWSFDIKSAPHGRYEIKQRREGIDTRVFVPERVILATKCKKVLLSHYIPEEKRWLMLGKGEQPVAWAPWPTHPEALPEHPHSLPAATGSPAGVTPSPSSPGSQSRADGGADITMTHANIAGSA